MGAVGLRRGRFVVHLTIGELRPKRSTTSARVVGVSRGAVPLVLFGSCILHEASRLFIGMLDHVTAFGN